MITPEAKKMLEDAGYGKGEPVIDPAMIPVRFQDAVHPTLPSVGRIVHFYHTECAPYGPYAAVVHAVRWNVASKEEPLVEAEVDLNVSLGGALTELVKMEELAPSPGPWKIFMDVPAVMPGVKHDHKYWWQWPERT